MSLLWVWRHPKPREVAGRCIGHTEVVVDRRKAKRLAHRIRRTARRNGLPRVVWTSTLMRSADVGGWLARWGWQHRRDARLSEMDFGAWDGLRWHAIGTAAVDAWCGDFADHAPGGGESVSNLLGRCAEFAAEFSAEVNAPRCVVSHAGWISAMIWLSRRAQEAPSARSWPAAVGYSTCTRFAASVVRPKSHNATT